MILHCNLQVGSRNLSFDVFDISVCHCRSFVERAPDIYFYSTLVAHLLELLWSIASAAVGSAMVDECPAERMIPISLIGNQ